MLPNTSIVTARSKKGVSDFHYLGQAQSKGHWQDLQEAVPESKGKGHAILIWQLLFLPIFYNFHIACGIWKGLERWDLSQTLQCKIQQWFRQFQALESQCCAVAGSRKDLRKIISKQIEMLHATIF